MRGLCKQSPYESPSVSIKKGGSDWSRLLIELNVWRAYLDVSGLISTY
jgi:hypothetical protein